MSFVGSNILAGASGQGGAGGYAIERSLRFNSGDSYLNRTPSSAGNRKTWTWSCWIKRNNLSSAQNIFVGSDNPTKNNTTFSAFYFHPDNNIYFGGWNSPYISTNAVYRDASAWYHIVLSVDTTQSTSTDRIKVYVNNELQSYSTGAGFPGQNTDLGINQAYPHYIGGNDPASGYASHMYADVHFIDGQALAPTDFGETDDNGVWQPKEFAGSYTLPASGSGIVYSSLVSGPTSASPYNIERAFDGDLTTYGDHSGANTTWTFTRTFTSVTSLRVYIHGGNSTNTVTTVGGSGTQTDTISTNFGHGWHTISLSSTGSTINSIAFTRGGSGNPLSVYAIEVNGTVLVDGTPAQGTNSFHLPFSDNSSNAALGTDTSGNSNTWTVNNIAASAPGLATANQGMDVVTYSGNSTARNIGGLAFAPDLVIIKSRSNNGYNHYWVDRVRGTNQNLYSNSTESTHTADRLSSFNSDGFGLTNHDGVNSSGKTYVAWAWKAGGAASSNTDGTITSSVSANNTYGFSIVSYTGNNTSGATVGHGLGSDVKFLIVKSRNQAQYWHVWHSSLANNEYIYLNATNVKNKRK